VYADTVYMCESPGVSVSPSWFCMYVCANTPKKVAAR
jgi:hypothetical protein